MKLSAAIRIGSMTTKQIAGQFTDGGNGRCALGAAIDATGRRTPNGADGFAMAATLFPVVCLYSSSSLANLITDWNDTHRLTREQIADRVEMIEEALEHDGYMTTGVTEAKSLELVAQEGR